MSKVTRLLETANRGDRQAATDLLSLDATALVHEAYLRLVGEQHFEGRGQFAATAEAMRRILVDAARWKLSEKHGGDRQRA